MKIAIPEKIKSEIDSIEAVYLEIANTNTVPQTFDSTTISDKHIKALPYIELNNSVFEYCTSIQYKIVYKNKIVDIIKYNTKQQSIYKSINSLVAQRCVRFKVSETFEDSEEGRNKCFEELDKKTLEAESLNCISYGNKNLIYYTIFFDKGYVELLNESISSILAHSNVTFDILLITDKDTKEKIELQPFVKKIKPKYLILDTPFDGIEASQYKTRVFEYPNIKEYSNILFLDCDIICIKNIDILFKNTLEDNILYTARNLNLNYGHHKTIHHGFTYLDNKHVFEMTQAKQMPFNAGQFLFKNSNKMQKHFENVNWFMEHWSGEYFFEQAFMNYYFCKAYITESTLLHDKTSIVSTVGNTDYEITNNTCLVHFIAPPLDANTKLTFIKDFKKNKTPSFFKTILRKIKSFFRKLFKKHEQPTTY